MTEVIDGMIGNLNVPAQSTGRGRHVSSSGSRRQLDDIRRLIERNLPGDVPKREDRIIKLSAYCLRLLESRSGEYGSGSERDPAQITSSIRRRGESQVDYEKDVRVDL